MLSVPQLLPRIYRQMQAMEDERRLAKVLLEAGDEVPEQNSTPRTRRTNGHDPARLRGLPEVGRNVTGATVHTNPVGALLRKEARGELRR